MLGNKGQTSQGEGKEQSLGRRTSEPVVSESQCRGEGGKGVWCRQLPVMWKEGCWRSSEVGAENPAMDLAKRGDW